MARAPAESLMLREAREAPRAVARLLAENAELCRDLGARLRAAPPPFAVSCARGSSDNAATYAKYLMEIRLGLVTASVGPSVRSVYAAAPKVKGALFIAVSQSGRSPDLLHLAEAARAGGALTLAFVNETDSPLAAICEATLPLYAGAERSVAATKSWICSLAAVLQLVATWAEDRQLIEAVERLPDDLERAASLDWSAAAPPLAAAANLFVVGRGIGLALAQEAALKLKETCGIHAEALSAAELMHGPLTLAGADFPALVFSQHDEAYQSVADLIATLSARDVPVVSAGPTLGGGCLALPCDPAVNPFATPIVLGQSLYPLVETVARMRGRDPDRPPHLTKVTETV
jgi:glucosamine--fructose-6-phosphate aminotransferase (isomerizing)